MGHLTSAQVATSGYTTSNLDIVPEVYGEDLIDMLGFDLQWGI